MKNRSLWVSLIGIVAVAAIALVATFVVGNKPALGLDLQGGASVVLQPKDKVDEGTLETAIDIIRNRVDGLGVAEPEITRQGNAVVVNLPGVKDQDKALQIVGQTAELRFRPVLEQLPPDDEHARDHDRHATTVARRHHDRRRRPRPSPARRRRSRRPPRTAATATTAPVPTATTVPAPPRPWPATAVPTTPPAEDDATRRSCCRSEGRQGQHHRALPPRTGLPHRLGRRDRRRAVFDQNTNEYVVTLTLKGGENGIDTFNKVAQQCFNGDATCPAGAEPDRARSPSPSTAS